MNVVYSRLLDQSEVERIQKLELMDEFEEWHLIQGQRDMFFFRLAEVIFLVQRGKILYYIYIYNIIDEKEEKKQNHQQ